MIQLRNEPHVLRAAVSDTGKYSLSSLIRNARSVNRLSPMITGGNRNYRFHQLSNYVSLCWHRFDDGPQV